MEKQKFTIKLSDADIKAYKQLRDWRDASLNAEKEIQDNVDQEIKEGRWYVYSEGWDSQGWLKLQVMRSKRTIELNSDNWCDLEEQGLLEFWTGEYSVRTNWVSLNDWEGDNNSTLLDYLTYLIEERKLEINFV